MKTSCVVLTGVLLFLAAWSGSQPSVASGATIRSCSSAELVRNRLFSVATVVSARGIGCAGARGAVRSFGAAATSDRGARVTGGRFRLGQFRCFTYFAVEESRRADCRDGKRGFWVDYGS